MDRGPDRDITGELPGVRRIMQFLQPSRNESVVYFEHQYRVDNALALIDEHNARGGPKLTFFHLYLTAVSRLLHRYPRLNRYAVGRRIYQRADVPITFSMKKSLQDGAPLVMVKLAFSREDTALTVQERILAQISEGRSDKASHVDKEIDLFLKLPRVVLDWAIGLIFKLDYFGMLPGFFWKPDPMYTGMVVANLGSVGLDAAYHHLYEYGSSHFFAVIGKIQDEPVVEDGEVVARPCVRIKYSFDERIADGLSCALALERLKYVIENEPQTLFDERWEIADKLHRYE